MKIVYQCKKSLIDFTNARNFLNLFNYKAQNQAESLAWRILDPFGQNLLKQDALSLTDKMDYTHQIRFFMRDRVERMLSNIAKNLKKSLHEIQILNSQDLDEGSLIFFKLLALEMTVRFESGTPSAGPELSYNTQELKVLALLSSNRVDDMPVAISLAQRYLNVGNAWTAEKILKKLLSLSSSIQLSQMLSFALNMQGKSEEAEALYEEWKKSEHAEDKVRASYVLSMLYARHHSKDKLSMQQSKAHLSYAYEILLRHNENTYRDYIFDKVFNRNGYALILFREGKLQEAADLLSWGIDTLKNNQGAKEHMHLSVLYFNIAQIYERMNNYKKCVEALDALIEIDPFFAEYHAERARIFLEAFKDTQVAHTELRHALELDPSMFSSELLYEYLYYFSEEEAYSSMLSLIALAEKQGIALEDDVKILKAEALLNLKEFEKSREVIETMADGEQKKAALDLVKGYEVEVISIAV